MVIAKLINYSIRIFQKALKDSSLFVCYFSNLASSSNTIPIIIFRILTDKSATQMSTLIQIVCHTQSQQYLPPSSNTWLNEKQSFLIYYLQQQFIKGEEEFYFLSLRAQIFVIRASSQLITIGILFAKAYDLSFIWILVSKVKNMRARETNRTNN